MKNLLLFVLIAAATAGGVHWVRTTGANAETALKASLCKNELNDVIEQKPPDLTQKLEKSSLGPHVGALGRMQLFGDVGGRAKRISRELSVQCPDRFPKAESGEKLILYTMAACAPK